jgi:hypothetical protein
MDLPPASLWRAKSRTGSAQTGSHTSPAMRGWRKLAPSSRKKITRPSRRASSGVILCEKELLRKGRSRIVIPRSASNSSTSRYDKEKRTYQPTARGMTSDSNCLHLNRPETDDARSIGPAYQTTPAKLQHCPFLAHLATQPLLTDFGSITG